MSRHVTSRRIAFRRAYRERVVGNYIVFSTFIVTYRVALSAKWPFLCCHYKSGLIIIEPALPQTDHRKKWSNSEDVLFLFSSVSAIRSQKT